jgi:pimeloyl-ACP methyl ester carboxylesterase
MARTGTSLARKGVGPTPGAAYCTLMENRIVGARPWLALLACFGAFACGGTNDPVNPEAGTPGIDTPASNRFTPSACPAPLPAGLVEGKTVRCGTLTVPETRALPAGKTVTLSVRIVNGTENPKADPIVHLQGGPGGSYAAYDDVVGGEFGLETSRRTEREIVFFDQRGTGKSKPALSCTGRETRQECLSRLAAEGIDLAAYNTEESARDVEDLRVALGYERINLYGQSYGTILAQTVMRLYPSSVRSTVLESVSAVPFDAYLTNSAKGLELALARVFSDCAADASCARAFPDPAKDLAAIFDALAAEGADPSGVVGLLSTLTQLARGKSFVPLALRAIATGDTATINAVVSVASDSSSYVEKVQSLLAAGANSTINCFDYGPLWTPTRLKEVNESARPAFQSVLEEDTSYCGALPPSRVSDAQRLPFRTEVPTLQLSGSHDSNTPKEIADSLAPTFSKGYQVTIPGWGHVVLAFAEPCSTAIFRQFVQDPSKTPDTSCLSKPTFATSAP